MAVMRAVRGMDKITPMEPDTLLTTSVDSSAELMSCQGCSPILYRYIIGEEKPTFLREELCLHSDERPVVGEPTTGFTSHPQPVTGLPGCSVKNQ